ncbi:MAG: substrate-binding domain-containing protein [Acidimicrobiia bacterium]
MRRLAAALLIGVAACGSDVRVVVAAGTTLVDSGVLERVVADFEARSDVEVSVVDTSSLRVLELGRRGGADVLLSHHPAAEADFLAEGFAVDSASFMESRFLLLAPSVVAATLHGETLAAALVSIAQRGLDFVGRRDGSGTAAFEESVWAAVGLDPVDSPWYSSTGLGMGETLLVADDRRSIIIAEEGAYLSAARMLDLVPVELADQHPNPYRVTLVADSVEAREFYEWLLSPSGREAIIRADSAMFEEPVYRVGE